MSGGGCSRRILKGLTRIIRIICGISIPENFGEKLITTQGLQKEEQEQRKKFLDRICGYFEENAGRDAAAPVWLREMISEKKY